MTIKNLKANMTMDTEARRVAHLLTVPMLKEKLINDTLRVNSQTLKTVKKAMEDFENTLIKEKMPVIDKMILDNFGNRLDTIKSDIKKSESDIKDVSKQLLEHKKSNETDLSLIDKKINNITDKVSTLTSEIKSIMKMLSMHEKIDNMEGKIDNMVDKHTQDIQSIKKQMSNFITKQEDKIMDSKELNKLREDVISEINRLDKNIEMVSTMKSIGGNGGVAVALPRIFFNGKEVSQGTNKINFLGSAVAGIEVVGDVANIIINGGGAGGGTLPVAQNFNNGNTPAITRTLQLTQIPANGVVNVYYFATGQAGTVVADTQFTLSGQTLNLTFDFDPTSGDIMKVVYDYIP